ncbi:unnamed protein product [Heterobilharzia americana]|nr:unnamed protein product [Heterobilharzia americana]
MEVFFGRPKLNKSWQLVPSLASSILPKSVIPFPIILTEDLLPSKMDDDDDDHVSQTPKQIKILQTRGCYGVSRNDEYNFMDRIKMTIRHYDTDDDDDEEVDYDHFEDGSDTENSIDNRIFKGDDIQLNENTSKTSNITQLFLSDVETLFLSHGLDCLQVYLSMNENSQSNLSTGSQHLEPLSLSEVWFRLCTGDVNMPYIQLEIAREKLEKYSQRELNLLRHYAVYIYYRSKGWIVRPGLCVGGVDYLLYAESPNLRHASFCVLIDRNSTAIDGEQLKCASVAEHTRVAHSVGKRVILCRVCLPSIDVYANNPWEAVRKQPLKKH